MRGKLMFAVAAAVAFTGGMSATPALAQLAPMKMGNVHKQLTKGKDKVAIPSYGISFIVAQKANANASISAQSSLESTLAGVDEATMRKLANEAHADLKAQLAAAGIALASDDEARGTITASGATLRPGNMDDKKIGGGVTFGKTKIRKGYVTVGADAAPLTTLFQAGGTPGPFQMMSNIGNLSKLYGPAEAIGSLLIFPVMTVDFADTEAKVGVSLAGNRRASVDSEVRFIVRGESRVDTALPMAKGRSGGPGGWTLGKDYMSDADFTKGPQTASAQSNDAPLLMDRGYDRQAGGVQVDLPRYVALVQEAYRAYNASIVEALKANL